VRGIGDLRGWGGGPPGRRPVVGAHVEPGRYFARFCPAGRYDHAVRRTGAQAYRGPRRRRFPPGIERLVRRRHWSAWTAVAALAAIVFCGGTGSGYEFSDSRAHGVFVVLVLVVWAADWCSPQGVTGQYGSRAPRVGDHVTRSPTPRALAPYRVSICGETQPFSSISCSCHRAPAAATTAS
jgi:hypothetical protein